MPFNLTHASLVMGEWGGGVMLTVLSSWDPMFTIGDPKVGGRGNLFKGLNRGIRVYIHT